LSILFTKTANYFYTKIEDTEVEERRYLFDSDDEDEEQEENTIDISEHNYGEVYNQKYPSNFTSIYLSKN
jgi:hypothetical protein